MSKRPSLASSMKALAENTGPDPVALVAKAREPEVREAKPPATRAGMKKLLTPVDPDVHKRLKMLAVQSDTTLEAITRAALDAYLSEHSGK